MKKFRWFPIILCAFLLLSVFSMGASRATSKKAVDFSKPVKIVLQTKSSNPQKDFTLTDKTGKSVDFIVNKLDDKTFVLVALSGSGELTLQSKKTIVSTSVYTGEIFVQSKENLKKILPQSSLQQRDSMVVYDAGAPAAEEKSAAPAEGSDSSSTNVQVKGVDEADIVKVMGEYIFYSVDNVVYIARGQNGNITQLGRIVAEDNFYLRDMYVDTGRLILLGNSYRNNKEYAKAIVYDISNIKSPKVYRSLAQEGYYVSSRKIDQQIYLVSTAGLYYDWALPAYVDSAVSAREKTISLDSVRFFPGYYREEITTIGSLGIKDKKEATYTSFMGSAEDIYMTSRSLYINYREYPYYFDAVPYIYTEPATPEKSSSTSSSDDQVIDITPPDAYLDRTVIKKFAINGGKITYVADARIVGTLINQFAMDESGDYFRVAYTRDESSGSEVAVFDKNMKQVGKLTGIAPTERIYSVRFMGDKLYLVTFKQVDPFFVVDMKNPRAPKILGYLKIPGYSSYLHPYDENHIIGFGFDTKNVQSWTQNTGIKIAMFDVSDTQNPKQISNVSIGAEGTSSELMYNHKALMYNAKESYFGFPILVTSEVKKPGSSYSDIEYVFEGGYVYSVDSNYKLVFKGNVTHKASHTGQSGYDWDYSSAIQRMVYIGDYIYSVSPKGISSNRASDMKQIAMMDWKN